MHTSDESSINPFELGDILVTRYQNQNERVSYFVVIQQTVEIWEYHDDMTLKLKGKQCNIEMLHASCLFIYIKT